MRIKGGKYLVVMFVTEKGKQIHGDCPRPFRTRKKALNYFRKLKEEKLISEEAHEKITWKNANRLLGLRLE